MKKALAVSVIALGAGLAMPASAAWFDGNFYGSIAGGVVQATDLDTKNLISSAANEELDFDTGYAFVGAVGDASSGILRSELEVGYRSYDVDGLDDTSNTFADVNMEGDVEIWNFGYNAYYDFHNDSTVHPYLGAGVGAAHVSVDTHAQGFPMSNTWSGEDIGFYVQGIAGVAMDLGEKHEVFAEYRYFRTVGVNAESNFGGFTPDANDEQFENHSLMLGIRFEF